MIAEWVAHRLRIQEVKPRTVNCQATHLRSLLRSYTDQPIKALTPARAATLYQLAVETPNEKTGKPLAAASHHLYLWIGKSFFTWTVGRGYVGTNPFAKIAAVGKVSTGKKQLRLDEARLFLDAAFRYYEEKEHPLAIRCPSRLHS